MPWRAARPAPTKRSQGMQSRALDNEARDCLTTNFKIDIIENIVCARIMNVAITLCAASATARLRPQNWPQKLSPFFCGARRVVKKIITTTQICKVSKLVKGPLKIPNFQGWQGSQVFQTSQIARGCERLQRCQKCLRSRQYQRP